MVVFGVFQNKNKTELHLQINFTISKTLQTLPNSFN